MIYHLDETDFSYTAEYEAGHRRERATYYPSSRLIIRCVIHVNMFLTYEMIMIKSNASIIIMKVITYA